VSLATGPVASLLMMTGNEKFHRNNVIFCGTLNFTLNIILIPFLGAFGAAIATCFSIIIKNILALHYVNKNLKIKLF
jgi:O-antigen/teichoic acid export membrane protein